MTIRTEGAPDPFTENGATLQAATNANTASSHAQAGSGPMTDPAAQYTPYSHPYGSAAIAPTAQPYGSYGNYGSYGATYNTGFMSPYGHGQFSGMPYGQSYTTPYAYPSSYNRSMSLASSSMPPAQNAAGAAAASAMPGGPPHASMQQTGTHVLNTMQDAMTRFARVSALIDDMLRHLHMLFDAIFGLGYSLGAVRAETRLWFAVKTGPVAVLSRVLRAATSVWRILTLFFLSPMAGRFSPVALVLRILGLVPEDVESSLGDLWAGNERPVSGDADEVEYSDPYAHDVHGSFSGDNSNM